MAVSKSAKKVVKKAPAIIKPVVNKPPKEEEGLTNRSSDLTVLEKLNLQEKLEIERIGKLPVNADTAAPQKPKAALPTGILRYYDTINKRYGSDQAAIVEKMIKFNPKRFVKA